MLEIHHKDSETEFNCRFWEISIDFRQSQIKLVAWYVFCNAASMESLEKHETGYFRAGLFDLDSSQATKRQIITSHYSL